MEPQGFEGRIGVPRVSKRRSPLHTHCFSNPCENWRSLLHTESGREIPSRAPNCGLTREHTAWSSPRFFCRTQRTFLTASTGDNAQSAVGKMFRGMCWPRAETPASYTGRPGLSAAPPPSPLPSNARPGRQPETAEHLGLRHSRARLHSPLAPGVSRAQPLPTWAFGERSWDRFCSVSLHFK